MVKSVGKGVIQMTEQEYKIQIECLQQQVDELRKENAELQDTVQWMHDLIWEIWNKQREIQKI